MSTIDERIVRLRFENEQFEKGIATSEKSLESFKKSLQFKKEASELERLQKVSDAVNFKSIEINLEALKKRFTGFGQFVARIDAQVQQSIMNSAKSLYNSTLGQIKSGGWARAMNISNAQFQIEGLGHAWADIEGAISYGVKDTAYGLDAAAKAASQLAASGVDFKEAIETVNGQPITQMHKALRAISGVAAMTNSSYEDISRIFTGAAGKGVIMGDELMQLAGRGLNVAADLGKALNMSEAEVRDAASKRLITFEMFMTAMDDLYGQHAKEANKTFEGAYSNMKAALSRVGALFATPIIEKANAIFNALTKRIDEFKSALGKTGGVGDSFTKLFENIVNLSVKIINTVDISFLKSLADAVDNIFDSINALFTNVSSELPVVEELKDVIKMTADEFKKANDVIVGVYGDGQTRINKLGSEYSKIQGFVNEYYKAGKDWEKVNYALIDSTENITAAEYFRSKLNAGFSAQQIANSKEYKEILDREREAENERLGRYKKNLNDIENALIKRKSINNIRGALLNIVKVVKNLSTAAVRVFGSIFKGIKKAFNPESTTGTILDFSESLALLTERLIPSEAAMEKIANVSEKVATAIMAVVGWLAKGLTSVIKFIAGVKKTDKVAEEVEDTGEKSISVIDRFKEALTSLGQKIQKIPGKITEFVDALSNSEGVIRLNKAIDTLKDGAVSAIKDGLQPLSDATKKIKKDDKPLFTIDDVVNAISWIADKIAWIIEKLPAVGEKLLEFGQTVGKFFDGIGTKLENFTKKIKIDKWFDTVKKDITDMFNPESDNNDLSFFTNLKDGIVNFISGIAETISKIDWSAILQLGAVIGTIYSLLKIANLLTAVSNFINGLGDVVSGVSNMFKAFTDLVQDLDVVIQAGTWGYLIGNIGATLIGLASVVYLLATVPVGDLNNATMVMVILGGLIIAIVKAVNALTKGGPLVSTGNSANIIKNLKVTISGLFSVGAFMLSMGTSMLAIVGALYLMNKIVKSSTPEEYSKTINEFVGVLILFTISLGTLIATVIGLTKKFALDIKTLKGVSFLFLSMSVIIEAIGTSMIAMAIAAKIASSADGIAMTAMELTLTLIFGGLAGIMYLAGKFNGTRMVQNLLSLAAVAAGVGVAMVAIASAMGIIGLLPEKQLGRGLGAISVILALMGGILFIVGKAFQANRATTVNWKPIAVAFGGMILTVMVISNAITSLGKTDHLVGALIGIGALLTVISGVLFLIPYLFKKNNINTSVLADVGSAFIEVAASMALFGLAVNMISRAIEADSFGKAIVALIAFLGVVVALGYFAGSNSAFASGLSSVANAFVSTGAGMALMGASVMLLALGIAKLIPLLPTLASAMVPMFETMDKYKYVTTIIVVGVVALTVALGLLIHNIAPYAGRIITFFKDTIRSAGSLLSRARTGLTTWWGGLTHDFKMRLKNAAKLIGAAILAMGPEIFESVGKLLIKLLAYLGSIAGSLAMGLVDFLINLINGVAFAIQSNSNRIMAALGNVIGALLDLVVQVLGKGLGMLGFSKIPGWDDALADASKSINEWMVDQTKAAEEADKAKRQYLNDMGIISYSTKDSASSAGGALDGLKDKFTGLISKTGEAKDSIIDFGGNGTVLADNFNIGMGDTLDPAGIMDSALSDAEDVVDVHTDTMNTKASEYRDAVDSFIGPKYSEEIAAEVESTKSKMQQLVEAQKLYKEVQSATNLSSWKGVENPYQPETEGENAGKFKINGKWYNTPQEYLNEVVAENEVNYNQQKVQADAEAKAVAYFVQQCIETERMFYEQTLKLPFTSQLEESERERYRKEWYDSYKKDGGYIGDGLVSGVSSSIDSKARGLGFVIKDAFDKSLNLDGFKIDPSWYTIPQDYLDDAVSKNSVNFERQRTSAEEQAKSVNYFVQQCIETERTFYEQTLKLPFTEQLEKSERERYRKEWYDSYEKSGEYIGEGLVAGIDSYTVSIQRAAKDLGFVLNDAFNKSLGIESPSKVFMQNGKYIVMGLANGINSATDMAIRSTKSLGDAVIGSFGPSLDYAASVVSGDIPYDMGIRPVVDMSNITSSARGINTLFQNQNVSLSGISGEIAADIGTLDNSNMSMIEELRSLRSDMLEMTERMTNMQMVLDTGTLVGEISPGVDRTLGQLAKFKGRGN